MKLLLCYCELNYSLLLFLHILSFLGYQIFFCSRNTILNVFHTFCILENNNILLDVCKRDLKNQKHHLKYQKLYLFLITIILCWLLPKTKPSVDFSPLAQHFTLNRTFLAIPKTRKCKEIWNILKVHRRNQKLPLFFNNEKTETQLG